MKICLAALLVGIIFSVVIYSPLFHNDNGRGVDSNNSKIYLNKLSISVQDVDSNTTLGFHNIPDSLFGYSIKSWLNLNCPNKIFLVRVGSHSGAKDRPTDLELELEIQENQIIIKLNYKYSEKPDRFGEKPTSKKTFMPGNRIIR